MKALASGWCETLFCRSRDQTGSDQTNLDLLDADASDPARDKIELCCRGTRQIDHTAANEGAAIIDTDDNIPPIHEVRHPDMTSEWQGAMRGCQGTRIEPLSTGGAAALAGTVVGGKADILVGGRGIRLAHMRTVVPTATMVPGLRGLGISGKRRAGGYPQNTEPERGKGFAATDRRAQILMISRRYDHNSCTWLRKEPLTHRDVPLMQRGRRPYRTPRYHRQISSAAP